MARKLRGRRAGAGDDGGLPAACRAAHHADPGRAQALAIDRARWCAASRTGCARTDARRPWCAGPPLARRASSPTRRSAASWRRTWSTRCARTAAAARAPSGNGKLKIGVDIPSPDEMRAIVGKLRHRGAGRWRPLLLTAIFTGLRASELRGLRWDDVDLKRGELHVRQRADRYSKIGRPKSEAGERTVPLPPMVVAALREHRLACPRSELDLVFPNSRGGIEHRNTIVEHGFHPAQIAAGVVDRHGGRNTRACTACATSTPRGASTGASTAGSNCRSRWCRRGSVTPRSR